MELPHKPLLKPWYRTASLDGAVLLQHGASVLRLEGKAAEQLLPGLIPLLDGTRTVDAIVALLGEPIRPAVESALRLLFQQGLLLDGIRAPTLDGRVRSAEFLAALDEGRAAIDAVTDRLSRACVAVVGSSTAAPLLEDLLRASGLRSVERFDALDDELDPTCQLALVLPSGEQLVDLPSWNRARLETGRPWLPVLPFDGQFAAVGPLVVPWETACYECFRLRRASNLDYRREFWALEETWAYRPSAPAPDALLAGIAATFALRWIAHRDPALPGVVHSVELSRGLELGAHVVYRVPRCPACSGLDDRAAPLPWFAGVDAVRH
jgi:bacteriocin biosynthesis cyclodehydratase domain-containing protein